MTKRGMRAFAAGLWAAAVVMACFFYFGQKPEETAAKPTKVTETQVQQYLASHKKMAVDVKTFESMKSAAENKDTSSPKKDNTQKTGDKTDNKQADKSKSESTKTSAGSNQKDKETKKAKSFTLHIQSGMTGGQIGEKLEHAGIISDWYDLSKYLQKHNLENKVQLGTFKVTSDMSISEIAKKITS